MRTPLGPAVYMPYLQTPHPAGVPTLVLFPRSPCRLLLVRESMHQLDSTLVVDGLRTMEAQVGRTMNNERALALLAIGFSILAMVMAAVGLYGVLAYSTEQRTREIGVRLALGAPRSKVVVLVVREMAWVAAIATGIALGGTVALARLFSSQLYGVSTFDPLTLVAAVFLTLLMVVVAGTLPARRAAGVEPMKALRSE